MAERADNIKVYLLDTGWGCGAVITDANGRVHTTAPIFRKFKGMDIERLSKMYKVHHIEQNFDGETEDDFFG